MAIGPTVQTLYPAACAVEGHKTSACTYASHTIPWTGCISADHVIHKVLKVAMA